MTTSRPTSRRARTAARTAAGAALVLAGLAAGCSSDQEPTSASAPTSSTSTGTDASSSPGPLEHDDGTGVPDGVGAEDWKAAAEGFARAFTATTGGREAWLAGLRPWVAPSLEQGYAVTELDLVPTQTFQQVLSSMPEDSDVPTVVARLQYSGGLVLDATIAQDPATQRWVVITVLPVDAGDDVGSAQPGA